ncbi:polyprenyl synthetase family protein [Hirschia litorea]|uniref:Polyprenyl synthetase family protein n=1 Tax=Hirschia litorea TaxID=1199156 RepID=A0ABW2IIM1_9PROT
MSDKSDSSASFENYLAECADKITVVIDQLIAPAVGPEAQLMRAMRHGALAGGKRLRPFITIEVGRMFDAPEKSLLRAASALECVHAYSLIHDDLPCMDDDDLRRGQPTVHIAFDEATAVLAGDALQTLAFEILANPETHGDATVRCKLIEVLASSSGSRGMVGGQMIDMAPSFDDENALSILTRMQRMKTGALFACAAEFGAIIGGANEQEHHALAGFTHDLGLAFQIKDDLLDVQGDESVVGKAVSKDKDAGKQNFVSLLGEEGAVSRVNMLADQAKQHLSVFGGRASTLLNTVNFVLDRHH